MCTIQFKESLTWIRVIIYTTNDTNLCYKARLSCEKLNSLSHLNEKIGNQTPHQQASSQRQLTTTFFFFSFLETCTRSYNQKLSHHIKANCTIIYKFILWTNTQHVGNVQGFGQLGAKKISDKMICQSYKCTYLLPVLSEKLNISST